MATISRLKTAEITNGNVVDADDIEAELDQLVNEANSKETRVDNLESNAMTIAGVKTFSSAPVLSAGVETNTISERTAASGVTIDGLLIKDGAITGYIPTTDIATQAEQETATATDKVVTSGRQHYHPSAAKAWAKIDGTGTPSFDASYNFSSIADNGTGSYGLSFTNNMSTANYSIGTSGGAQNSTSSVAFGVKNGTTPTASGFEVFNSIAGSASDTRYMGVQVFGDL